MKESTLDKKIKAYCKEHGIHHIKNHGSIYSIKGEPDHRLLIPRKNDWPIPIFIETKKPGKYPTPLQELRLQEYRDIGAVAFWCDNFESFETQIKIIKGLI